MQLHVTVLDPSHTLHDEVEEKAEYGRCDEVKADDFDNEDAMVSSS